MRIRDTRLPSLIFLISIFALNDFLFLGTRSALQWLSVDYASRFLAILAISCLIRFDSHSCADFGIVRMRPRNFCMWAAVLTATGISIDQTLLPFFTKMLPGTHLTAFPAIADARLKIFDLTLGLALVSITEEAIFRGYFFSVMSSRLKNPAAMVFLSSVIFGLIHWSSGLPSVITTTLWGILPTVSVMRTGSILPAVVAHFATDFVCFLR